MAAKNEPSTVMTQQKISVRTCAAVQNEKTLAEVDCKEIRIFHA